MPVMDHPVSREMGRRKTGSENMEPIATQPKRPPAATITQRYHDLLIFVLPIPRSTYHALMLTTIGQMRKASRGGRHDGLEARIVA
jgi:hypothetical protein